jgi:Uma2 family endonuclease
MSTVTPKLLTAEEFARLPNPPDGSRQELVRGVVVTMPPPGYRHGKVQLRIGSKLQTFLDAHPIGSATVESGVRTEDDPDTVRGPDVSFWSFQRLPADQNPEGYPQEPADLCVEVMSPHDKRPALLAKVREYLFNGVRLVWVVDPEDRTVTVFRQPDEGRVLLENATLTGEDVLPEFSCKVADFFT